MNIASPYRPGREIARGGMGVVLDARDQKLGRSVAMKVMLRRNASVEEQQRFLQEARVLGQLAHPNIVPVHDVGTDEQGRLFYTMKLVLGGTLHDVLGKLKAGDQDTLAKYPLTTLLTVFQKVCDAVAFAHSRGIIHRDLKPQNIMVGEFGEVLVMDWGLAKILPGSPAAEEAAKTLPWPGALGPISSKNTLAAASRAGATSSGGTDPADAVTLPLTPNPVDADAVTLLRPDAATAADAATLLHAPAATPAAASENFSASESGVPSSTYATLEGAVMGTPHYMSPEQADGRISDLDARSDIFSLGGILYALLTLRPPVEGANVAELLSKVLRGEIAAPTAFNTRSATPSVPPPPGGAGGAPPRTLPLPHLPGGRVPTALSAVAMKALALRREQRYPTVAALAADLTAFQGGFATGAENATLLTLLRLFLRRHKALAAAAVLIVVLTIGFLAKVVASERETRRQAGIALQNAQRAERSATAAKSEARRATTAEQTAKIAEQSARAAETVAVQEKEATRRALAKAQIDLAESAYREQDGPAMQAALGTVPADLRDSNWRYLLAKSDTSVATLRSRVTGDLVAVVPHPQQPGVFAIAGADGWMTLVEANTGASRLALQPGFPHQGFPNYRLACSPDGERLAIGQYGNDGMVLHRTRDGSRLAAWGDATPDMLEFSPDGRQLLEVVVFTSVNLREAASGRLIWTQPASFPRAVFALGGQAVLVASNHRLRLLNVADGSLLRELPATRDMVPALAVRADGTRALIGMDNGFVLCVELRTGRVVYEMRAHDRMVAGLAYTPEGDRFVTLALLSGHRQSVQVWDADTGTLQQSLLGGTGENPQTKRPVLSVHPVSGELVVIGRTTKTWNLAIQREQWRFNTGGAAAAIAFWQTDDWLFGQGGRFELELLDLATPLPQQHPVWRPERGGYRRVSVSADGRHAAVADQAGANNVHFLRRNGPVVEEVRTFQLQGNPDQMALNPAGDRLWTGVGVMDPATGAELMRMDRKGALGEFLPARWLNATQLVEAITAHAPRGQPGSEEQFVRWDATTGQRVQTITHRSVPFALAAAPDGRSFAEAGADKMVRVRAAGTLAVQQEFRAHDGPITALAFHPTAPLLASGSEDLTIKLWNLDTGRLVDELRGLLAPPVQLIFSPTGKRLACNSHDRALRVWEPSSLNPAAAPAAADGWENILAALTAADLLRTGHGWRRENGALTSPNTHFALLPLPGNLSGTSYQVRVQLCQFNAKGGLHLTLPVADRMVGFDLDGSPQDGHCTGLLLVNGKAGKNLPGTVRGQQVRDSALHHLEVSVRLEGTSARITATLDGQPLYEWTGLTAGLSQYKEWATPPGTLALGTMAADWLVQAVKVKRLTPAK